MNKLTHCEYFIITFININVYAGAFFFFRSVAIGIGGAMQGRIRLLPGTLELIISSNSIVK